MKFCCCLWVIGFLTLGSSLASLNSNPDLIRVEESCDPGYEFCPVINECLSITSCKYKGKVDPHLYCPNGYIRCNYLSQDADSGNCWMSDCPDRQVNRCKKICTVTTQIICQDINNNDNAKKDCDEKVEVTNCERICDSTIRDKRSEPDYSEEESEPLFHEPFLAQTTPPKPNSDQDNNSKEPCSDGQVYCLRTSQCSKDCSVETVTCPAGETYCSILQMCSTECAENQKFVKKRQTEPECPEGEFFCLDTGFCSADCGSNNDALVITDSSCPPGLTYCLQTESCSEDCSEPLTDLKINEFTRIYKRGSECLDGEYFCLDTGLCSTDCKADSESAEIQNDVECPEGMMFCLDTLICSKDCFSPDEDVVKEGLEDNSCPDGLTFCLDSGFCTTVSDCVHSIVRRDTPSEHCQDGQVFCLDTQRCAESCASSVFPSDRETRTQMGQMSSGVRCPIGHVFCLSINACIVGNNCGPFENASNGDSANQTCNPQCPERLDSLGYSNCHSDDHCQLTFVNVTSSNGSCCNDKEGYRMCVFDGGVPSTDVNGELILDQVCDKFSQKWIEILIDDNSSCNNTPSECTPGTICCNSVCYGIPYQGLRMSPGRSDDEEESSVDCQQGQRFCNRTGECVTFENFQSCYVVDLAIVNCDAKDTKYLNQSFQLGKVLTGTTQDNSDCWSINQVNHGACRWEILAENGSWYLLSPDPKICSNQNKLLRLVCDEENFEGCGIIDSSYIEFVNTINTANVRRLMVLGMAELPPPKLKRVQSLAQNLTLSYEEAFGQPIKLQRSFPVSDDRLTSGISRQVTEQMRLMGTHKFNWTEGSLAACFNHISSTEPGGRYLGLSLGIPQKIGQLKSMAFNVSSNNGISWQISDGSDQCYAMNTLVRLILDPANFSGPVSFTVTPCAVDCLANLTGKASRQLGATNTVFLKASGSTNPPYARAVVRSLKPPRVRFGYQQNGIHCGSLASYYFTDPDDSECSDCGLMIFFASGATIGHWEISSASGDTFRPLNSDTESLNIWQPCLQKSSVTFRGTLLPDDCGSNCTRNDTLRAAVCPSDGHIRFVRDDGQIAWTAIESLSIKIVFLAFDETLLNTTNESLIIPAPNCGENDFQSNFSLSKEFGVFYLEMEDCDGSVLSSTTDVKVLDQCGICGGSSIQCTQCTASSEFSSSSSQGCCKSGRMMTCETQEEDKKFLSSISSNVTLASCSKKMTKSLASFNQCGNDCTLPPSYEIDSCGRCLLLPISSGEKTWTNQCGLCDVTSSVSSGLSRQSEDSMSVQPNLLDVVLSPTLAAFDLVGKTITKTNYILATCWILDPTLPDVKIAIFEVTFKDDGGLKCLLRDPPIGQFDVTCQLTQIYDNSTQDTLTTTPGKGLTILNSQLIKPIAIDATSSDSKNYQISMYVESEILDYMSVSLACFYRLPNSTIAAKLFNDRATLNNKTWVNCGSVQNLAGNLYQVGIVFVPNQASISKVSLNTVNFTSYSTSPSFQKVILTNNKAIRISFAENIQGPSNCSDLFDETTMLAVGGSSLCTYIANDLRIITPNFDAYALKGGKLKFKTGNGIIFAGSMMPYASEVSPTLVVEVKKKSSAIENTGPLFSVDGPSQFCYNTTICGMLRLQTRLLCGSKTTQSRMDFVTTNSSSSNNTVVWQFSINITNETNGSRNRKNIEVCLNQQLSEGDYMTTPVLYCPNSNTSKTGQGFNFKVASANSTMVLDLGQPRRTFYSDAAITLRARVVNCDSENPRALKGKHFRYYWSVAGNSNGTVSTDLSKKDSSLLKLGPGSLQGGTVYNFTLSVIIEQGIEITDQFFLNQTKTKNLNNSKGRRNRTLGQGKSGKGSGKNGGGGLENNGTRPGGKNAGNRNGTWLGKGSKNSGVINGTRAGRNGTRGGKNDTMKGQDVKNWNTTDYTGEDFISYLNGTSNGKGSKNESFGNKTREGKGAKGENSTKDGKGSLGSGNGTQESGPMGEGKGSKGSGNSSQESGSKRDGQENGTKDSEMKTGELSGEAKGSKGNRAIVLNDTRSQSQGNDTLTSSGSQNAPPSKGSKGTVNATSESNAKGGESKGSKSAGNGTNSSGMPKDGKEGKDGANARTKRNSELSDGMGSDELSRDPLSSEDTTIGNYDLEVTNDTLDYNNDNDTGTDDNDQDEGDEVRSGNGRNRKGSGRGNRKRGGRENLRDDVTGNVAELLFASAIVTVGSRGIVAQIAAQEVILGIDSNIELDASASADLDNNNQLGPLQFIWTCLRSDGSACLTVIQFNQSLKTLEEQLTFAQLTSPILVVPKGILRADMYMFTVNVSRGLMMSQARSKVTIQDSTCPSLKIKPINKLVNPANKLTIRAFVSSSEAATFNWESVNLDGYSYLDLSSLLIGSLTARSFLNPVENLPFDLVIPPGSMDPSSKYMFKLVGVGSCPSLVASLNAEINTRSGPFDPQFDISPREGLAMLTEFTLTAEWSQLVSETTDLTYRFGCRPQSSTEDILISLEVVKPSDPVVQVNISLPYLGEPVIMTVKVCNDYNVCDKYEDPNPIMVSMPDQFTVGDISMIGVNAAEFITEKDPFSAIALGQSLVTTLKSSSLWSTYQLPVCALQFTLFVKAGDILRTSLDSQQSVSEALALLKEFSSSECFSFNDPRLADTRLNATNMANMLRSSLLEVAYMHKSSNFESPTNVEYRQKRSTDQLERIKRQTTGNGSSETGNTTAAGSSSNCSSLDSIFSTADLQTMLSMDEKAIINNTQEFKQQIIQLLESLHSHTSTEMCRDASSYSDPERLSINVVDVSVQKKTSYDDLTNKMVVNVPNTTVTNFGVTPNSVTLGSSLRDIMSQLECCGPCNGITVFAAIMTKDLVSVTSNRFNYTPPQLVSNIMDVRLLNSATCQEVTLNSSSTTAAPVAVVLQVPPLFFASGPQNDTSSNFKVRKLLATTGGIVETNSVGVAGLQMRCLVFYNNVWNSDLCKTSSITMAANSATAYVNCDCSVTGYVAVGLVDSQNQVTYLQEVYKFRQAVQITINANSSLCLNDKTNFLSTVRTQLATFLKTDPYNFLSIDCSAGSIILNFELVASDDVTAAQLNEAYQDLVVFLERGLLVLRDQNGQIMKVPAQCVQNCDSTFLPEQDLIALIVGSIALAIVLFIILCIICAVCIKKKKRAEKRSFIMPVQPGVRTIMFPPTYRDLQYADSLEGTDDSLVKYRRKMQINQGSNSILLEEEYDAKGVPIAARYHEPNKQQLSQTLTEEMLRKMSQMEQMNNQASPRRHRGNWQE